MEPRYGKVEFAARLLMIESMSAMARSHLLLNEFDNLARSLKALRAGALILGMQDVSAEYFVVAPEKKKRAATKPRRRSER